MMEENDQCFVECGDCESNMSLEDYQLHKCFVPDLQSQPEITEDNIVAKLAEAVQARPALWDHTKPLRERTKDIKELLWKEVHKEINGTIPLEQIGKKWRNLKDTLLKHLKAYKPTGSGSDEKRKWKHFDILFFLAEKNMPRKTYSNVAGTECFSNETTMDRLSPTTPRTTKPISSSMAPNVEATPSSSKRLKRSDETEKLLLGILKEAPPKPTQTISPALLTIHDILEKLPSKIKMQAELEMLTKVYNLYDQYIQ